MKKLFLILVIVLAVAPIASAAPFLICDPQTAAEIYTIYSNGSLLAQDVPAQADGSLKYDLQGMAPGQYSFTAMACNIWGCSAVSDPFVSAGPTVKPSGVRLTK